MIHIDMTIEGLTEKEEALLQHEWHFSLYLMKESLQFMWKRCPIKVLIFM